MEHLLGSEGYAPLGMCFKWDATLLVLTVVGNLLAALAMIIIPVALLAFLRRGEQYKSFHWVFWNVYHPAFALEAGLDFFSGVAFLSTAILMWPMMPKILALPRPEQMDKAYDELKAEMIRRESAEYRNRQLASIVESSNDAIVSFMLNGTVLSWNRGAQELFGYSVESTMGRAMRQLIGPTWT